MVLLLRRFIAVSKMLQRYGRWQWHITLKTATGGERTRN